MSTSRNIDRICMGIIAAVLVITILFMNGSRLGLTAAQASMGYETRLFDTDSVHRVDIVMDDWDTFIENCESEEYSACTVVIDGESYKNVALRAKGNTSLSNVRSLGSQRYSFKIEFDHYESGKTYYGLDKLCLNNLIQDNTMMKDYLVYQMMKDFGVDTPLCSFVYITVNGEDWGLYLAVEGVEDSFLARNYGSSTGELYKPDSMSFGGGRGNGRNFNMDDFTKSQEEEESESSTSLSGLIGKLFGTSDDDAEYDDSASQEDSAAGATQEAAASGYGAQSSAPDGASGFEDGSAPGSGGSAAGSGNGGAPAFGGSAPDFSSGAPDFSGNAPDFGGEMPDFGGNAPDFGGGFDPSSFDGMPEGDGSEAAAEGSTGGEQAAADASERKRGGFGGFGMGSDDVKLKYIDDDPDSYSNIFNNAKTDVTKGDKARLIASLKNLSEYTDLEDTLDMEEVLRYFVVHNFVVNGDSYTGSMIHNYYLHEKDGKLGMIPWDYNLAFGTFQAGNASEAINSSIDSPVSGGNVDDRPMVGWIFSDESYTEWYHELFEEFMTRWFSNGQLEDMIEKTAALIRPYVEKDPTKFCTAEEFETGIETMTEFVRLRAEAVRLQLESADAQADAQAAGTEAGLQDSDAQAESSGSQSAKDLAKAGESADGSGEENAGAKTTGTGAGSGEPQAEASGTGDAETQVDVGDIDLSDMGSMGGGGGGFGGFDLSSMIKVTDADGNEVSITDLVGEISNLTSLELSDGTTVDVADADFRSLMKVDFGTVVSATDKDGNVTDLSGYTLSLNMPSRGEGRGGFGGPSSGDHAGGDGAGSDAQSGSAGGNAQSDGADSNTQSGDSMGSDAQGGAGDNTQGGSVPGGDAGRNLQGDASGGEASGTAPSEGASADAGSAEGNGSTAEASVSGQGGGSGFPGPGQNPFEDAQSAPSGQTTGLLVGASFLVLAAGILIAVKKKNTKTL